MEFSTAIQQMVAIARAVSFKARLVIMDEPTSSLDEREVAVLFDVIRQLRAEGVSVIFVSHRLDEVFELCDRVTVFRGRRARRDTRGIGEIDRPALIRLILGGEMEGEEAARARGELSKPRSTRRRGMRTPTSSVESIAAA